MKTKLTIDHHYTRILDLWPVIKDTATLDLSAETMEAVAHSRAFLEGKIAESDAPHYGINTGFGSLCDVRIPRSELSALQENLVKSHAAGMGDPVPDEIVRLILFLKVKSLGLGYSGVRPELVRMLTDMYNNGICPDIRQLGSLGASGDLAPLAHMSLTLLGEGVVRHGGREKTAAAALQSAGLSPMSLHAKEGLALLNGTQFSTGYAVWGQLHGEQLIGLANVTAALSLDAFNGKRAAYSEPVTRVRPHRGAMRTARTIEELLAGSSLPEREGEEVQDPYSFRCVPQVHGATWDALDHTRGVIETEINAVTDNPLVVPRDGVIISAGNFHAQPIALALDYMAIALSELGNIAERRIFQLIDGHRGLPVYLTRHAGLHSGFMIPQYTAASMVSQNKQLCTPASVDSIVSSHGQEDHVSMAANAGTKAYRVVENVYRILAIEWMTASMAMEFRRPHKTSPVLEDLLERYRKVVPALDHDRILSEDMERTVDFIKAIDVSELMEHD